MRFVTASIVVVLSATRTAVAQQTAWGQCGGMGWSGATTCVSGYTCTLSNAWYSQCLPGGASTTVATTTTSTRPPSTSNTTTRTSSSTTTTTTSKSSTTITTATRSSASSTASAGYPGSTLLPNYYWIRAVADPNFHKYLQTTSAAPGIALIDSWTTAGQFQIVSGQLVQTTASGLLYANVAERTDTTVMQLAVTFKTAQNTYGTFSWSGDALQWSIPSISRPNLSAWYVCTGQQLFINLGAYLYLTPAGCADQTIHYYNGATAVS